MGLFAWLSRRVPGLPRAGDELPRADSSLHEPGPQTRFGMRPGAMVAGLDFFQAIEMQRRWKLRLAAYARGEARQTKAWRDISRDDQCDLGRWLRQAARQQPDHAEVLARLLKQHAALHRAAAEVVRLADGGQRDAALQALRQGAFAHASHATVAGLSELFTGLNATSGDAAARH